MTCAVLARCKFVDANATGAVIDGADCSSADFTRCDLTGVAVGQLKVSALSDNKVHLFDFFCRFPAQNLRGLM
jgi:uncharacterized protein YjbI with pentapeptide repeats